jgi:hypothetical protein
VGIQVATPLLQLRNVNNPSFTNNTSTLFEQYGHLTGAIHILFTRRLIGMQSSTVSLFSDGMDGSSSP